MSANTAVAVPDGVPGRVRSFPQGGGVRATTQDGGTGRFRGRRGDVAGPHRRRVARRRLRPARRVPGAPNCPMFPADNVWNTPIANLPGQPASAAWLASMDASTTNLHPDFGPSGDPSTPYGIPYTVVSPSQPVVPITFQYADQSDPGPVPLQRQHADRGRSGLHGRPPRHHGQPGHLHPLRALRRAVQRVGLDRRFGRDLEPQLERPAPGRMDVGGRGRPADPPGPRALRRGAVGRHHPCHPDDGRGDGHVVPLAGPPRGRDVVEPGPAAHGGPLPAQGRATTSRATRRRPRWSCAPCSSTG